MHQQADKDGLPDPKISFANSAKTARFLCYSIGEKNRFFSVFFFVRLFVAGHLW
jgi:hypothetical protein